MTSWISIFGWVLAVASTITVIPQAVRVHRHRDASGVSATTVTLAVGTMTLWCIYTLGERDYPALGSSIGPFLVWGSILLHLVRFRPSRTLGVSCAAAVGAVVVFAAFGVPQFGAALGSLVWALPQAITTVRERDLDGVSASAYAAIAVENLGWIVYAVGTQRPAYAFAPLVQAPLSVFIALRAKRSHSRSTHDTKSVTPTV